MTNFLLFWRVYCGKQYGKLWFAIKATAGGLFGRATPEGWNPYLMYDHGAVWRLLRDVLVLVTTAGRIVFGVAVLVSLGVLMPLFAVLRALVIPLIGVIRGARLMWLLRGEDLSDE